MISCEEHNGKILYRSQIKLNIPTKKLNFTNYNDEQKYICIFKNKKWRWVPLASISNVQFKKYKNQIINQEIAQPLKQHEYSIVFSGDLTGNHIDDIIGTYYYAPEFVKDNIPVYWKKDSCQNGIPSRWLYATKKDNLWSWWIGTFINMKKRAPWGFWKSKRKNTSVLSMEGAEYWDGIAIADRRGTWKQSINFSISSAKKKDPELEKYKKDLQKMHESYNIEKEINKKTLTLIKELYNKIGSDEREAYINNGIYELFKKTQLCHICFKISPLIKCLHFDCVGACAECRKAEKEGGGGDGTCCACKREQKAECPVCTEIHTEEYLKILPCKHVLCWKCICNSYECGHPIKKCPQCRSNITT